MDDDYNNVSMFPRVTPHFKGLYASQETSGDAKGDYLQLEKSTFKDLLNRKKIEQSLRFEDLKDPLVYDYVAERYDKDLEETFKIPTPEERSLWSWRPGWYQKYKGDINAIPDDKTVELKTKSGKIQVKKARDVMLQRQKAMQGYLQQKAIENEVLRQIQ